MAFSTDELQFHLENLKPNQLVFTEQEAADSLLSGFVTSSLIGGGNGAQFAGAVLTREALKGRSFTFQQFVDAVRAEAGLSTTENPLDTTNGSVQEEMQRYLNSIGGGSFNGSTAEDVLGDLSILVNSSDPEVARNFVTQLYSASWESYFTYFRDQIIIPGEIGNATGAAVLNAFVNGTGALFGFDAFMQRRTTKLQEASADPTAHQLQSYEEIFLSYYPGGADITNAGISSFALHLQFFAQKMIAEYGYFNPTHFVEQWHEEIKKLTWNSAIETDRLLEVSDSETERLQKTRILITIFELITEMLASIQKASIRQAQRLEVMGKWQKAYSEIMADVPTFVQGKGYMGVSQGDDVDITTARSENNQTHQAWLEKLRTERQLVQDEMKQYQSNISTLTDAASAQANLATAFLQNLSGILLAIFR